MYLDETLSVMKVSTDSHTSYPHFINMRTMEILEPATKFLIAKSEAKLHEVYSYANKTLHADFEVDRYYKKRKLLPASLDTYAMHLRVFLTWCELKGQACDDYERYNFKNITSYQSQYGSLDEFANDLAEGNFGDLKSVAGYSTRLTIADEFLKFLYATGEREIYTSYNINTPSKDFFDDGSLDLWTIPLKSEIEYWISGLKGEENKLIAELICYAGFRRADILNLKVKDVPKNLLGVKETPPNRFVYKVHKSKGSKDRLTTMPQETFYRLLDYISKRKTRLKKLGLDPNNPYVFVSTRKNAKGKPFSAQKVSQIFRPSAWKPPTTSAPNTNKFWESDKWHPHMGRHAFACHRLVELIYVRAKTHQTTIGDALANISLHQGATVKLANEMGHAQVSTTTDEYMQWIDDNPIEVAAIIEDQDYA